MDKRLGTAEPTLGGDLTLAADGSSSSVRSSDAAIELAPGTTVDRYVIVSRLGAGAMGVVYAAYDPKLDRKVALKLLRSVVTGRRSERHRARLAREAKALARIAHPNVVTVFDVGTFGERVWVAMEFVAGMTLRRWLATSRPSIGEILDVLAEAGRGLQAAHTAGLVHRDFKPDNVMVEIVQGLAEGESAKVGRVRVMDFGLARDDGSETGSPALERSDGSEHVQVAASPVDPGDSDALTLLGDVVGTPAYMSPEQHLAQDVDARSDQFSFCVVLWETLLGERPYGSGSPQQVGTSILEGRRRSPPAGHPVPRWVMAVLDRGLQVGRDDRFPSMAALLDALDRGRKRRRGRWLMGGAALVGLAGFAGLAARHVAIQNARDGCAAAGALVQAQWPGRAAAIERALSRFPPAWDKTRPWLDRWADEWTRARGDVCVQSEVEGTLQDLQARAAVACLSAQQTELASLLDWLSQADAAHARSSVLRVSELSSPRSCIDPERLRRGPWPPAHDWEEVERIRDRIAALRPRAAARARDGLRDEARDIMNDAQSLGWAPVEAEALLAAGWLAKSEQRYEGSEEMLERAYWIAGKAGDDQLAAEIATKLAHVVGYDRARYEEGLRWGAHAEMMLSRLDEDSGLLMAELLRLTGAIDLRRGDLEQAAKRLRKAAETYRGLVGEFHPDYASALTDLAFVHFDRAEYDEARALHRRARAIWADVLGARHPTVASSIAYEALVEVEQGDPRVADELLLEAQQIQEDAYGLQDRAVAHTILNRSIVLGRLGRDDEALELASRSLGILERTVGPDHPDVAAALNNLGLIEERFEHYDKALDLYERALRIKRERQGAEHAAVATTLVNIGDVHRQREDFDRAQQSFEQALAIFEKASGPDHPSLATTLVGLGTTHVARGSFEEAIPLLERAVSIRVEAGVATDELAAARFELARALWYDEESRARAMALAHEARDEAAAGGPHLTDLRARIEQWLESHAPADPPER